MLIITKRYTDTAIRHEVQNKVTLFLDGLIDTDIEWFLFVTSTLYFDGTGIDPTSSVVLEGPLYGSGYSTTVFIDNMVRKFRPAR